MIFSYKIDKAGIEGNVPFEFDETEILLPGSGIKNRTHNPSTSTPQRVKSFSSVAQLLSTQIDLQHDEIKTQQQ